MKKVLFISSLLDNFCGIKFNGIWLKICLKTCSAQNNIRTLLYLPWDKNSYSTSFKSQKFLIWSAKRCVNIVNITKNIDSRTQIAL